MLRIGNLARQFDVAVGIFLVMAVFLTGCATSQGRPSEHDAIVANDSLMLVFVREFSFDPRRDDIKATGRLLDCVQGEILRLHPKQPIVSFDQFRRLAFPEVQPESVPRHPEYLSILFDSAEFRETIEPLKLRYVVFIGGVVETNEPEAEGFCVVGYGGAACFVYIEWDKASKMGATVLDLKDAQSPIRVSASATGKAWFAIVGVFPIGLPSDPSDVACKDLGVRIAGSIARGQYPAER